MATSFLSPGDVADLNQVRADGFATVLALGGISLTLLRYSAVTGRYEALPVQTVALKWDNRQPRGATGEGAAPTTLVGGTVRGFAPFFDVKVDDRFTYGGFSGRIVPPLATVGGVVSASFQVDESGG